MRKASHLSLRCLLLACSFICSAQQQPAPKNQTLPDIHFVFDHPELQVTHYEIDIDSTAKAHYESQIRGQEKGSTQQGIVRDFNISPATRDRIFSLAKAANNLDGNFDFTRNKIAFTGTKSITLNDEKGSHSIKLVWSENRHVMELVELLQGISGTLEEEPVLQRMLKHDRLGLNAELGKMEKAAGSGWLREINLISGILKEIADDPKIMDLARKRAERLLKLAAVNNET
jgi:hypothetical protein